MVLKYKYRENSKNCNFNKLIFEGTNSDYRLPIVYLVMYPLYFNKYIGTVECRYTLIHCLSGIYIKLKICQIL